MKLKHMDYVSVSKTLGVSSVRLLCRHILPNVMHIVMAINDSKSPQADKALSLCRTFLDCNQELLYDERTSEVYGRLKEYFEKQHTIA